MHVVYIIIHKERLKEGTPPFYYIGSKYNWKGEGTYYGSSRHPLLKNADKNDLDFKVIWKSEDCTLAELQEVEKQVQQHFNVVSDDKFFNLSIANSTCFHPSSRQKAAASFSKLANQVDENGVKNSVKWSAKSHANLDTPDENGITLRERLAILAKERLSKVDENGLTLAKRIGQKSKESLMKVGEDGLTGYQRQGKALSEYLNSIDPETGLKYSQLRKTCAKTVTAFGKEFSSVRELKEYAGITEDKSYKLLLEGKAYAKMYKRYVERLGKEVVEQYIELIPNHYAKTVEICGQTFQSKKFAAEKIGLTQMAISYLLDFGKLSEKTKAKLIEYFGEETFNRFYE